MNVLVVAPHPDDEALGCGGAVLRHVAAGDAVSALFLTSGELGLPQLDREEAWRVREAEAGSAAEVLGLSDIAFLRGPDWTLADAAGPITSQVRDALERSAPDLVYVPHRAEWHPDHRAAHAIVVAAASRTGLQPSALLEYEVWTPLQEWDVVEDIGDRFEDKLAAIRCYESQLTAFDYVRSATGLAQYRGALAGRCDFAEIFNRAG